MKFQPFSALAHNNNDNYSNEEWNHAVPLLVFLFIVTNIITYYYKLLVCTIKMHAIQIFCSCLLTTRVYLSIFILVTNHKTWLRFNLSGFPVLLHVEIRISWTWRGLVWIRFFLNYHLFRYNIWIYTDLSVNILGNTNLWK